MTASNENSMDEDTSKDVLVSREGLRKQRVNAYDNISIGNSNRRKKTAYQVDYLRTLYHRLGGKWNG